jgi:hypothetical protein
MDGAQGPHIGELFVEQGRLSLDQLNAALVEQQMTGQNLGEILVTRGYISRLDLASAIGTQWRTQERPQPAAEPAPVSLPDPYPVAVEPVPEPYVEPYVEPAPEPYVATLPEQPVYVAVQEPQEPAWPANDLGPSVAALADRIGALEETTRLIDDLQASLRSAYEHSAATAARLDQLEAIVSNIANAHTAFTAELESQRHEVQAVRSGTAKLDGFIAAARAFLSE